VPAAGTGRAIISQLTNPRSRPLREVAYQLAQRVLSPRTLHLLKMDGLRLAARLKRIASRDVTPSCRRLHLGCGARRVPGWLNVDVAGSDYDVDLSGGRLPWRDGVFDEVVSQHVIEHVELVEELLPLLKELRRVLRPGGRLWLNCPDLEAVCRAYVDGSLEQVLERRMDTWPNYALGRRPGPRWERIYGTARRYAEIPTAHLVNDMFHQWGEHKNLYDLELLGWALRHSGFGQIRRIPEAELLGEFPGFPPRLDPLETLHVCAVA
jgi:predicted SAM-dependent methyltransferase